MRRAALVCFLLLCDVVCGEALVRWLDPWGVSQFHDMQRYYGELCELPGPPRILRHRRDAEVPFRDFTIRTNSLGLRGPQVGYPKPAGEKRLLFLGDSVVLGWGAKEAELFVTRAAELLGPGWTTVNGGHNQYDTTQEAAFLEEVGPGIDPDAVLLVFVGNDVVPTVRAWEALQAAPEPGALARAWGWVRGVLRGLNGVWVYLSEVRTGDDARFAVEAAEAADNGWVLSALALERIAAWCEQRRIPFVILDHTPPGALPALSDWCEDAGVVHAPFDFTENDRRKPIRHSSSDPHANALGHALLLDKLVPALRALGI